MMQPRRRFSCSPAYNTSQLYIVGNLNALGIYASNVLPQPRLSWQLAFLDFKQRL